jgi:AcrR family transcriptional regulator
MDATDQVRARVRIAAIAQACGTSTAALRHHFPERHEALRRTVKLVNGG